MNHAVYELFYCQLFWLKYYSAYLQWNMLTLYIIYVSEQIEGYATEIYLFDAKRSIFLICYVYQRLQLDNRPVYYKHIQIYGCFFPRDIVTSYSINL